MQNKIQHFHLTSVKRKMVELMKKLSLQNNLNQFNHRGILVFVLFGHKKAEAGEA